MRALLGRVYDRSTSLPSANNHFMLDGTEMARARLAEIAVPALVIHGAADPLFPLAHGEALAREIPGAELLVIDGLGHELPPSAWDEVLPALIAVTGWHRARAGNPSERIAPSMKAGAEARLLRGWRRHSPWGRRNPLAASKSVATH
jgi:hypothetical protein